MTVALIGYGKMGREIERVASERNLSLRTIFTSRNNPQGTGLTKQALHGVDVCIDFSTPVAVLTNIEAIAACGKNVVVGTTGWYDKLEEVKKLVKAKKIGMLYSPNFSLGMNIFSQVLTSALRYIDKFDVYDAAIQETHHAGKADSPSGTAIALGEIILQHLRCKKELLYETAHRAIKPRQLHVTSTRIGHAVGEHRVRFDSEADSIELVHTARNRAGFALGALIAAEWLKGKKGVFTMKDVLT
ncbi:MAG TPA: 4-hydroxy-tetrahydrodipicolinate reductase [Bacteroidota bacterium]|nr:4-hydroxy-tetrahydrodipicolinate reductase [Bacteroidota bacterium]